MVVMCAINSYTVFGQDNYESIRIGLVSLYSNTQNVELSSANHMNVGYLLNGYFIDTGDILSSKIHIKASNAPYYTNGEIYYSYNEAKKMVNFLGEGAIVAHIEKDQYQVYTTYSQINGYSVPTSTTRIEVFDEEGNKILIAENDKYPIVFQGVDYKYTFPVTGVKNREYRGVVEIVRSSSGLTPVNVVEMEDYLYGVVPSEMVPSWPIEALKAQAVAARSLAITQYSRNVDKGYNLVDTVQNQVYKGVSVEQVSTNRAVDETEGIVAKYNDAVAETLFFSTSGGVTEDPRYVWGGAIPYLQSVDDHFEKEPEAKPWVRKITTAEIEQCLLKKGQDIGSVLGMEIASRTPSGRVNELKILGTHADYSLVKEDIRTFFSSTSEGSLKSRLFSFSPVIHESTLEEDNKVIVAASGGTLVEYTYDQLKDFSIESVLGVFEFGGELFMESANGIVAVKEVSKDALELPEREVIFGDVVIYGKGFGHGVGMSQSGAKGLAQEGYSFEEILHYYYKDITLSKI